MLQYINPQDKFEMAKLYIPLLFSRWHETQIKREYLRSLRGTTTILFSLVALDVEVWGCFYAHRRLDWTHQQALSSVGVRMHIPILIRMSAGAEIHLIIGHLAQR